MGAFCALSETLTVLTDITAGPCLGGGVPSAVIPQVQGLLLWESPPGLGRTETSEGEESVRTGEWAWGHLGGVDRWAKRVGGARGKDWPRSRSRGHRLKSWAVAGVHRELEAYLVQSGHKKQDENEDVKGRDH